MSPSADSGPPAPSTNDMTAAAAAVVWVMLFSAGE